MDKDEKVVVLDEEFKAFLDENVEMGWIQYCKANKLNQRGTDSDESDTLELP